MIISIGYRVKSLRGTEFRKWATARLKEYIVKGFTMDDERLKGIGKGTLQNAGKISHKKAIERAEKDMLKGN